MRLSIVLCVLFVSCVAPRKNVCRRSEDYENINDEKADCWFNPDADARVEELPGIHGYPLETHKATTNDGFVLTVYRIPHGLNDNKIVRRQPVYLQHGMLCTSSMFMWNGNGSLAFMLADAGFDVWMGNARGSYMSRKNLKYTPKESRYWDFSFHEMGIYDIPSTMDLIALETGRKDIIYAGHSMGTTMAYIYASSLPKHASKRLKLIVAMAPEVFMGKMRSGLKIFTTFRNVLQQVAVGIGYQEFLPYNPQLFKNLCLGSKLAYSFCQSTFYDIFGRSPDQHRPEFTPVLYQFLPAGTSQKSLSHYGHMISTDKFTRYDYGPIMNLAYYRSMQPPEYDLSKVTVPSFIMHAGNDNLSPLEGAIRLNNSLKNSVLYELENPAFNHMDFIIGRDATDVVFKPLINYISQFKS